MLSKGKMAYLGIMILSILAVSISFGDTWYGMLSAVSGIICVVLVAEGRISNFYWGMLNCALYGFISYQNRFYGDMILNWAIYLPFQFIGLYMWKKNLDNVGEVVTRKLSTEDLSIVGLSVALLTAIGGFVLSKNGGANPYVDSANVVLSLVATVLMAQRYREQWLCWILVNITGITMWSISAISNDGQGTAALMMWVTFLVNSIYGYWSWTKRGY